MKKLMIAAAVAAMGLGAFADACNTCNTCSTCNTDCTYAYEFILLAKSTEGKATEVVKADPCSCQTCGDSCCYRKPRMRKYAGFVFGTVGTGSTPCASGCGCLPFYEGADEGDDTFADGWNQLFWDVRTKQAVWDGEDSTSGATLAFEFVDAIGYQGRDTVEAVGAFTVPSYADGDAGVMTIAGFGSRGKRGNGKYMVKSISGFCAGTLPCYCTSTVTDEDNPCQSAEVRKLAYGWTVCSDVSMCPESSDDAAGDITNGRTAAYGKWTLKWNATAAARLQKSYTAATLVKPGYDGKLAAAMDADGLIGGNEE